MAPLLLLTAVLLLVAGAISAAAASGVTVLGGGWLLPAGRATILAVCALPVAVVLGAGAWAFHRDVKRARDRSGGG